MTGLGKSFILLGLFFILIGVVFLFYRPVHCWGRLPGDILLKKGQVTIYIPITTSLLLSVVFSLLIFILSRFWR